MIGTFVGVHYKVSVCSSGVSIKLSSTVNFLPRPSCTMCRMEPLYNGHVGAGKFVRYKEVSFIERFVQEYAVSLALEKKCVSVI